MITDKFTRAKARLLRMPLDKPVGGSGLTALDVLVVELETGSGHTGWGFSYVLGGEGHVALAAARELLARHVDERAWRPPQALWRRLSASLSRIGLGAHYLGLAAIDVAAWDLYAKRLEQPLGVAMGGELRAVPVYGSGGFRPGMDPQAAVEVAQRYVERGCRAIKLRASAGGNDASLLRAVRDALPAEIGIMVDANEKGDALTARRLAFLCAEFGVLWLEEPLPAQDRNGYAALARTSPVALAAGEHLQGTALLAPFLEAGSIAVAQPDVAMMGGLTECLRAAELCEHHGVSIAPHFLPALFMHLAAVAPNLIWLEDFPLLEPLFDNPVTIGPSGTVEPLPAAGHGLRLAAGILERMEI